MFAGRKYELSNLNQLHDSNQFECVIIYGRRRVGKTSLIKEFIKNKNSIYFQALQGSSVENLVELSNSVSKYQYGRKRGAIFQDFQSVLDEIKELSKEEHLIFIIDEYPYLAESYPTISSLLQKYIDHDLKNQVNMTLILCGSSMSFMEKQVLGGKSPLYGRRTAQFKIKPLSIWETQEMLPHFSHNELFTLYSVTGGIPLYLSYMDDRVSLKKI